MTGSPSALPPSPFAVLFGLDAVDELDRTAFAVLLPDIRDHFGLSDAGALALVAATTIAVLSHFSANIALPGSRSMNAHNGQSTA